ncbi:hypothetical protein IAT38_006469 [Cryptococcus sp. DSM 104549]
MAGPSLFLPKPRSGSPTTPSAPTPPPPPAYPPCELCSGTYPLPTSNLTTLDPLMPEIRSLIFDFVKTTQCRSHLVNLICTSRQLYRELAPVLYQSVVLDQHTTKGFYYGLGGDFGGYRLRTVRDPRDNAWKMGRISEYEEAGDMAATWMPKETAIILRDTSNPFALISHTFSLTLADDAARVCTLQAIRRYDLFASALLSKMGPSHFQNQCSGAQLFRFAESLSLGEGLVRSVRHPGIPHHIIGYLHIPSQQLPLARIDFHSVLLDEPFSVWFGRPDLHLHLAPEDSRGGCSHLDDIVRFVSWYFDSDDNEMIDPSHHLTFHDCAAGIEEVEDRIKMVVGGRAVMRWRKLRDQGAFNVLAIV